VVRGGAALKMMEEHAHHDHVHDDEVHNEEFLTVEESVVSDALSQIRTGVLEAANPVGEMVDALGSELRARAHDSAERAGKARELQAKRAA
jgi:hypothetical protein